MRIRASRPCADRSALDIPVARLSSTSFAAAALTAAMLSEGRAQARAVRQAPSDQRRWLATSGARPARPPVARRGGASVAFVAAPIITAAIEGRLPRGFGAKRLMDLPIVWSHQWTALGLKCPAQS